MHVSVCCDNRLQVCTNRWEEVLEGLRVDEREVHAAEHPGERVSDGFLEAVPGAANLFLLASVGQENTILSNLPLLLRQPSGILGPVREEEEGDQSDEDTGGALDDEEPLPAGIGQFSSPKVGAGARAHL